MKLPCKVAQDMLPIYYDGVCSEETAELIEQHLQECSQCAKILADLDTDMHISTPTKELEPLKKIQKKWNNQKRQNIQKGICITLAALLLIATVLTGVWYFSYARYYFQMTKTMVRTAEEDRFFTSSDYTAIHDGYRFEVWLPIILSDCGFARIMDENGTIMFLYAEVGGEYNFRFIIDDESGESWSVHINKDLTPDFENYQFPVRNDAEKEHITQLLMEHRDDIKSMLDAVYVLWGIDLL